MNAPSRLFLCRARYMSCTCRAWQVQMRTFYRKKMSVSRMNTGIRMQTDQPM